MNAKERSLAQATATAILGIDTLWGGDVMNPSGTGRFIADSWFSDEPLPRAYKHPAAAKLRQSGGVAGKKIDVSAVDAYLKAVDIPAAIGELNEAAGTRRSVARRLPAGPVRVPGRDVGPGAGTTRARAARAVRALRDGVDRCGADAFRSVAKRERIAELLARQGYKSATRAKLLAAVDAWRRERMVPKKSIAMLADACIAQFDAGSAQHIVPFLPRALRDVPRANIRFLAIENAWFSGSMNYIGRARNRDGSPQYEATYEINAALEISVPEFMQLVSHEVVPGHVTNFAWIQALYARRKLGFESTVLTMNTRGAALSEGIANNAILMAFGVTEIEELPDIDLQIGTLLALLQDDAKNQSSFLTWEKHWAQDKVRGVLRNEFLCSDERADKLSGAWGRHPLLGRMYLPAYRAGTVKVAALRRKHAPEKIIPALYGALGLVDLVTIDQVLGDGTSKRAACLRPRTGSRSTRERTTQSLRNPGPCICSTARAARATSASARYRKSGSKLIVSGKGAAFTRANRPVSLAAIVWFENRSAAASMEVRLKALARPAKLAWFERFTATTASVPATLDVGLASLASVRR